MRHPFPLRAAFPLVAVFVGLVVVFVGVLYDVPTLRRSIETGALHGLEAQGARAASRLEYAFGRGDAEAAAFDVALLGTDPSLLLSVLLDERDRVLAASDPALTGRPLADLPLPGAPALVGRARASRLGQFEAGGDGRQLSGAFPFRLAPLPGELRPSRLGVLYLQADLERAMAAPTRLSVRRAALQSVLVVLALVLAVWYCDRTITTRVLRLLAAARSVGSGRRGTRARLEGSDELAALGEALDRTAAEIEQRTDELVLHREKLESLVADRTAELERQKEAAEAASRTKSAFLATMSHEIRTPLNAVLGFSQLLRGDAGLTRAQREQVESIQRSGQHLLGLVNDVLEMAKIESGSVSLNLGDADLHALLDDVETMFRIRTDRKRIGFRVTRGPGVPRRVSTDESKLRQVLVNLVANAVRFTAKGSVELRADAAPGPGGLHRLVVEVEDTGPGISPEELSKLFQRFQQTEAGVASGAGTGLGLAISRGFARLLGGDVTVRSRVGEGSVFRVEVPVATAAGDAGAGGLLEPRRVSGLPPGAPRPRVLVADDAAENRAVLSGMLGRAGLDVETAVDGRDAVERFRASRPHLVLMDLRMPVLDGYEAIREIRASDGGDAVPIIVVTADAFEEDRRHVLRAGGDDFLPKPFREADLLEKVGRLLSNEDLRWESPGEPGATDGDVAPPPSVAIVLPEPLRAELRAAVVSADAEKAASLAADVGRLDAAAGAKLADLIDRFEYEALLRALDRGRETPPGTGGP